MKESTLMQYISYHLHTYIKKFTKDKILLTSVCMQPSFWDPAETDTDLQNNLLQTEDDFPIQLIAVQEKYLYAVLVLSEAYLMIGPVQLDSPLNLKRQLASNASDFSNPLWQDMVYTFPYWSFFHEILFVHHIFAGHLLTERELLLHNCIDQTLEHQIQKDLSSILFTRQEEADTHNSYQQELREQSSIENGDMDALERSFEEDYAGTLGTLSKNKLRQYKNLGIVVITLASRSAIRGGLNPEISFSLSDNFIQKIEEMNDAGAVLHIIRDAEREYTQMVHEIRRRQAGAVHAYDNPHVEQCKKYIFSHLHDRITVQDLSYELGLNANYLSELFKSHEGITLSEYIMQEKINRAKNLLIYSQYSYIEIATYLGFSSQSHLGKQFKKHTGDTLKHFRDKYGWREGETK